MAKQSLLSKGAAIATGFISNLWRPRKEGGVWFYPLSGTRVWENLNYLDTFNSVPEVNAVINKKAAAFSRGVLKVVNSDLEEQPNDPVAKLLKKPNWFQGDKEFMRQTKLFHEIYGNEYMYALFGVGSKPVTSRALYSIPPNLVECEYEAEKPFFMEPERPTTGITYKYKLFGKETPLALEQIIHLNDNRVTITEANRKLMLLGEPRLKGLTPAVNNIKMAYETRGVILAKRGAMGILSNAGEDQSGPVPLLAGEAEDLQRQYSQYGGLESQNNLIITSANLKWQQMAVAPDKLGLFTETEEDFNKICDAYGTPRELFSSTKGTTYENQNQAWKGFYDSTTIPEANEWVGGLNGMFFPEAMFSKKSNQIVIDYSHLAIFQEDLEKNSKGLASLVTALSTALLDKAITIQQYQDEMAKFGIAVGNKASA